MKKSIQLSKVSEKLLYAVKIKAPTHEYQEILKGAHISQLLEQLDNDENKKSFWINVYNSYFQIFRQSKEIAKSEVYKTKRIEIANESFSLDDVEHGILRKYRYKYSLGLFSNPFTRKTIKQLAVNKIDYRIHFALNCGAESCPPIAFYNQDKIDKQLDLATISFLEGESTFLENEKVLLTSKLLQWFKYDFGGRKGINHMYATHLTKEIADYTIKYNEYSWEEQLSNFAEN